MNRCLWIMGVLLVLALAPFGSAAQAAEPNRIGIRTVDGRAGFFDTVTGDSFVPRGANYIDFSETPGAQLENWMLATNRFDPDRIRAAFQQLHSAYDYNTVRIFLDHCDSGPQCITVPGVPGLNPAYLDNLARLIQIAAEEGVYLILTTNDLPDASSYNDFAHRETSPLMYGYRNVHFLTESGVEAARQYWSDLLTDLNERAAPLSAVLGWSLMNEHWLFEDQPPLSLDEGQITISTGRTYDMADPAQKREMAADALVHYSGVLRDQIQALDPGALVTMGFFTPGFPNETAIGDGWFVDTVPLLERAPLDFFDFHAYPASDITLAQMAENFGMIGYEAKPVIMGEVGAFQSRFASSDVAAVRVVDWIAESCQYGFDGWLYWEYYGQYTPGDLMWGLLADNGLLLFTLSPVVQPDACVRAAVLVSNIALDQAVTATASTEDEPAEQAVDGTGLGWSAGSDAPQGIQIDFDQPRSVNQVRLTVEQFPEGRTLHRVWVLREDGSRVLLSALEGVTRAGQVIDLALPAPLTEVIGLQVATLESPSWVAWREIEAFEGDGPIACLATVIGEPVVRARPSVRSPGLGPLNAGEQLLVAAQPTGENADWLALTGGGFVRADLVTLAGACDNLPAEAPAQRSTVPVTFLVRVPASTPGDVYLAGDLGPNYPQWDPAGIRLQSPLGAIAWAGRLDLPPGAIIQYKYTLGSWETVEKDAECAEVPNRTFVVDSEPMIVRDVVEEWRVIGECDG